MYFCIMARFLDYANPSMKPSESVLPPIVLPPDISTEDCSLNLIDTS